MTDHALAVLGGFLGGATVAYLVFLTAPRPDRKATP